MKTTSLTKIFDYGIFGFMKIMMRGAAQVMFQNNILTGLLFIAGIFWGAYASGNGAVAWGALLGLMVSTCTGFILNLRHDDGESGLWGFNGILVGCAFPTFMAHTIWMWLALVLCAALTTWVREGLNNVMQQWRINSLTFPFVLCTWIFLFAAHQMDGLLMHNASAITYHTSYDLTFAEALGCWLRGISQVFLIDSWVTGLLFLIALAISNCRAAVWGGIGSALSSATAMVMGVATHTIEQGLFGFSATLTAIALATVFYRPCWRSAIWAVVGIIATTFVQAALNVVLAPAGVASLTAPFCIATWLFLLPMLKLDEQHPDHSSWSEKIKRHLADD